MEKCCLVCGKEKSNIKNKCCSRKCANSLGGKASKGSKKPREKKDNTKKCPICNTTFNSRNGFCSKECVGKSKRLHYTEKQEYYRNCIFRFSLNDYPEEFDFSLIEKYGWYRAKNRGDNLNGISRDHIYPVMKGYKEKIDPMIISHPANCQLLRHSDNISKGIKSEIALNELLEKIKKWDDKYGVMV